MSLCVVYNIMLYVCNMFVYTVDTGVGLVYTVDTGVGLVYTVDTGVGLMYTVDTGVGLVYTVDTWGWSAITCTVRPPHFCAKVLHLAFTFFSFLNKKGTWSGNPPVSLLSFSRLPQVNHPTKFTHL